MCHFEKGLRLETKSQGHNQMGKRNQIWNLQVDNKKIKSIKEEVWAW